VTPLVHIVVLNWQKPQETATCLAALAALDYPNHRVVVVNNGSADALLPAIQPWQGRIDLLHNPANLGYTGGCNVGIRHAVAAGADYVWLFNVDALPEPDCLTRLVAAVVADTRIGLASPVIRYRNRPDLVESGAGRFNPDTCGWTWFESDFAAELARTDPGRVMLDGTALLVSAELVRRVGLFDDDLFAYHETIDYSMRAQAAGFRLVLVADASVYHRPEPSDYWPPYVAYYVVRNEMLMWRKHVSGRLLCKARYWHLLRTIGRLKTDADPALRDACMAGWWHGEIGVTGERDPQRRAPLVVRWLLIACPRGVLTMLGYRGAAAGKAH
jgi:GT2 family glycosyltransferase